MFKDIITDPKQHNPENFVYVAHGIIGGVVDKRKTAGGWEEHYSKPVDLQAKLKAITDPES